MEFFIMFMPTIFCIVTGLLIAWGIQIAACLTTIMYNSHTYRHYIRIDDIIQTIFIGIMTMLLFGFMFIFPSFAAFHMPSIIVFELWYTAYLLYVYDLASKVFITPNLKYLSNTVPLFPTIHSKKHHLTHNR